MALFRWVKDNALWNGRLHELGHEYDYDPDRADVQELVGRGVLQAVHFEPISKPFRGPATPLAMTDEEKTAEEGGKKDTPRGNMRGRGR